MEQSTIIGLAVGVAVTVGAIVGFSIWGKEDKWDTDMAAAQIVELTDDYNVAIAEHPTDRTRSTFAFDLLAKKRFEAFAKENRKYPEFVLWESDFETQCKNLRKAIRKG